MPLHYHDFITPKSSGNAAIGKAVALGFLFLLVALGDDFFAQANTVGLEVEERAFRYGENQPSCSSSGTITKNSSLMPLMSASATMFSSGCTIRSPPPKRGDAPRVIV